jgi:hypothetical protein
LDCAREASFARFDRELTKSDVLVARAREHGGTLVIGSLTCGLHGRALLFVFSVSLRLP